MMTLLTLGLALLSLAVAVVSGFLMVQVLSSLRGFGRPPRPVHERPTVAILIPAHNEAEVIAGTLVSVMAGIRPGDRVLVVADNCSDDTAAIVRAHGAEVSERFDDTLRGKGYALDHGIRELSASPPDVLLLVDADCTLGPGLVDTLVRACKASGRPQQCLNLMQQPAEATAISGKIAEFAWLMKNQVRPLGGMHFGWPCQATGTGMAFPWEVLADVDLATGNIVEDMKLGVDLAMAGTPMAFCPHASIVSLFPTGEEAAKTQRRRWEHGHMQTLLGECPRLIADAFRKGDLAVLALALDLAVPPLSLFVLLQLGLLVVDLLALWLTGAGWPLRVMGWSLLFLAVAVLVGWYRWGRHILSVAELAEVPLYILRKIPLYLAFWKKRETRWVRTERK